MRSSISLMSLRRVVLSTGISGSVAKSGMLSLVLTYTRIGIKEITEIMPEFVLI